MVDESTSSERVLRERDVLAEARGRGAAATLAAFVKLSGPGWLQSAITLGGGSLAGSLYLGVIGGYDFLWLQPLMMILGVVMLSAIAYVTLSTGQRPFDAITTHISPVLGWGWLLAALMANLVWAMPQFSLGTAALQQNLLPEAVSGVNLGSSSVCWDCFWWRLWLSGFTIQPEWGCGSSTGRSRRWWAWW